MFDGEVIPLGLPVEVTIVPIEISVGWRARLRQLPKLVPYVAAGLTSFTAPPTDRIASHGATWVCRPSASGSASSGVRWAANPLLINGRLWPP